MSSTILSESRRVALSFAAAFITFSIGAAAVSHALTNEVPEPVSVAQPVSPNLLAVGNFEGHDNHKVSGEAYILKTRTSYALVLSDDFSLSSSEAVVLGFGNKNDYIQETEFAKLEKTAGRQTYKLPEGLNPKDFNALYIVPTGGAAPVGVATFN